MPQSTHRFRTTRCEVDVHQGATEFVAEGVTKPSPAYVTAGKREEWRGNGGDGKKEGPLTRWWPWCHGSAGSLAADVDVA